MLRTLPSQVLRIIASIGVIVLLAALPPAPAKQETAQPLPNSQAQPEAVVKTPKSRLNTPAPKEVTIPPLQIFLTALGAFLGALLSVLATIAIEYQRKPKLEFSIESPPLDRMYAPGAPASHSRFLRVRVTNRPMPNLLRWLGRSAAYHCTGDIEFHHLNDGAPVFSRAMPLRWAGSEEPLSSQVMPDGQVVQYFDIAKYNAAFRRDCFPGAPELVDVAGRFDNDDDCHGWSNESYLPGKGWRNPEFKLPKGRYLVKVTIRSSGDKTSGVFKLENSVAREHFRLQAASPAETSKLQPQD
jgi:hypothetical protein